MKLEIKEKNVNLKDIEKSYKKEIKELQLENKRELDSVKKLYRPTSVFLQNCTKVYFL
ncbi:MAG: hypothetical protein ACRDDY_09335 [Clostridium sp.]|uniref:hypothetical protein n=1 Tax=Clostridium sp. TaxID=1506 RepID=UPI003EE59FF2